VAEWVADWYSPTYYADGPSVDPAGPATGTHRIVRGGSWDAGLTGDMRSSARRWADPTDGINSWGFRVARTP
ncbi:MAG: formylglycine-generating enzyme family protein, partial [Phycisphaerales bacterium]